MSSVVLTLTLALALCAPIFAANAAVTELQASGTTASVTVSGETAALAVMTEVLDAQNSSVVMYSFPVENGAFSGTIDGLSLTAGTTYTLRAADYDGGAWTTATFTVPAPASSSSSAPSISLPATGDGPKVSATVKGATASLKVSTAELAKASGSVTLDLSALNKPVTAAAIPVDTFAKLADKADKVTIALTDTAVTLDAAVLDTVADVGSGNVTLSVTQYDKTPLDSAVQTVIGDRPVYELSLKVGEADVHELGGKATVSLPYTPKAGENPEFMVVWRMVDGIPQPLKCQYDAATGKAIFETETFSLYVVAYFPFADVAAESWYYAPAAYAYMTGLMSGLGEGCFAPDKTVSRAMLTTTLWALEGKPTGGASTFTDMADGAWYADAVNWAAANGIVGGYDDGTFGPDDPITREQAAAILCAYAKHKGYDLSAAAELSKFADGASVSGYAVSALRWAVANGLFSGKENGILDPSGSATRAETATILRQFCGKFVK